MNAVLIAVGLMLVLSLCRVHVVVALIAGAMAGGLLGGLGMEGTLKAFNAGLGGGATVALSYAMLGAFAVAIARSGMAHALADRALAMLGRHEDSAPAGFKWLLIGLLLLVAVSSQNILPIHIAFIPLLVPPLLYVLTRLQIDRRLIACVLTFGLITPYMFLPVGFGNIFLNEILLANVARSGVDVSGLDVSRAMLIPALGMVCGLLIAVLFSYRGKRRYDLARIEQAERVSTPYSPMSLAVAGVAVLAAFVIQLWLDSMILGALVGFLVFSLSGVVRWKEADDLFTEGMKMMAMIGFIMIAAAGFAEVMKATGQVATLVESAAGVIGHSKAWGAFLMLLVGLLVTMGIGSSFSTVPIIAAIFVPLAVQLGFGPLAIVSIVGTAGALGDAGSPASDSTLGPTSGLNVDGQHNHIWDTVVPTFLHYNLPLLIFGWAAAMVL
ncbi:TRAP transporter large permease subunit [Pseudomonas sp. ZM23]|uniref:TRAP transporter large permease subunit n=1 Tax=Pseudomonas triclosanedens TaxID=2961893 RepID=A0ABY6ZU22_9PSED|nr:Na+/H+ antiporter NhaC family protein [Pseudomonas triclosanedens]MCP8465842.1 TRAP transporter large permease subunit [Pseudomonas triclosanedens]MCP8472163.1 TRAP transporter large permease subunit [Pseudomonas triclosanedens]MCP8477141.1 TRAP transporter large permease subunit [Pseudomonas triclosanedens]WAI47520.1 TRAP transporter large permease subunit [Pseudomonas triclosanedens]